MTAPEQRQGWMDEEVREWADRYGTPLYIYDQDMIHRRIGMLRDSLHPAVRLFYSIKANPNPGIVRTIYEQGVHLELCSPGELDTALRAGAEPRRIMYLGPGKSKAEIERLLALPVGYFVAESVQELDIVQTIAREKGVAAEVGLRFNPREARNGARLKMGGTARQFGIDEADLPEALALARRLSHVRIVGLHSYMGTRILQADTIASNTGYILDVADRLMSGGQAAFRYIGLGGGFGVPYYEGEQPLDLPSLRERTTPLVESFLRRYPGVEPLAESGRFLVAESGLFLTRIRYTKRSRGVDFAIADGGVHQHAAAGGSGSLVKRNLPVRAFIGESRPLRSCHIAGPLCTPEDVIARQVSLPALQPGDLVGVTHSGAYGLTFSPVLFLSHPLPREVLVHTATKHGSAATEVEISRPPFCRMGESGQPKE